MYHDGEFTINPLGRYESDGFVVLRHVVECGDNAGLNHFHDMDNLGLPVFMQIQVDNSEVREGMFSKEGMAAIQTYMPDRTLSASGINKLMVDAKSVDQFIELANQRLHKINNS